VLDPYQNKKRYNHKIKIGQLKVLHAEETNAIAVLDKMEKEDEMPVLDVSSLMIGDLVNVHVK
jgi:sRNA-binding protein